SRQIRKLIFFRKLEPSICRSLSSLVFSYPTLELSGEMRCECPLVGVFGIHCCQHPGHSRASSVGAPQHPHTPTPVIEGSNGDPGNSPETRVVEELPTRDEMF